MRAWPLGSSARILQGIDQSDAGSQQQFRDIFDRLDCDPVSKAQCADAAIYLPGDLQVKMDRASMRYSLEVRSPLLDFRMTEIGASLTAPIAERVTRYLECVMGRGVKVGIDLSEPSKPSLEISRPGDPAPFAFAQLSGGAKEQVAAALRLAMAEILATGHDGCLPVLFDDAFANADPTRTHSLQLMLDQAATRGLQILVLSCTPADYHSLGAKETRLVKIVP